MKQLFMEAVFVGALLMVIVRLMDTMKVKGDHNTHVFMSGVLVHLICEFMGFNSWYCRNGFACQ